MLDDDKETDSAVVATGNPLAARAARQMLLAGGSAVDAAIAADAVLGVVEPMATGIGGDLLAMLVPHDGPALCYNGTGRSPAALTTAMIDALPGRRIPERHPLSVTVPGVVRGWHDLHRRYGRLPWRSLFNVAIAAARTGFVVAPVSAREWALFAHVLRRDPACALLYKAEAVPASGEVFINTELAALLEAIAAEGLDAFYDGAVADAAQSAVQARGGVLASSDFATHKGNFDIPLSTRFRDLTVLECPPNTHGIAVLDTLAAIDSLPLAADDPQATVSVVHAMRVALERAKKTVADPSGNTVCTVVVDFQGLAITLMSSIFKRFGSGIAVPGAGFVLQNRGFGFSLPGQINGPEPSKRPYHTVVPAAALKDGRFHSSFGVVGGAMQPQGHVQLLLRTAAWGEGVQSAIDAPRWRLESDTALALEVGTPTPVREALRAAGFVEPDNIGELGGRSDFGGAQMVMRLDDGRLVGGSDPRKDGIARVVVMR